MASTRLQSIGATDAGGARVEARRLSAARLERTLLRILKKNPLCAFATITPEGRAPINTAYFAYSRSLEIFLSHPDSLHCRNATANATMAIAVFESAQTWGALDRGLQLFGRCREARGAVARQARRAYAARFQPYAQWIAELEADDAAHEYRFYRFVASRVKVFDEREFGGAVFVTARISGRRLR